MVKMTATKMLTYDNRRLVPGEDFEAKSHRDMKVLLATRKAQVKREEVEVPAPPVAVAEKIAEVTTANEDRAAAGLPNLPPADLPPRVVASGNDSNEEGDLAAVRAEYKEKTGKQPYWNWDAATLREKMEQAGS